jgi:hypothetical protein
MGRIVVEIPHSFVSLNEYINAERANRYMAAKIKKTETEVAANAFMGLKPILVPCEVIFTWTLKDKRKDLDNVAFAKKFILDGAVQAKYIAGDGLKYIIGLQDRVQFGDEEKVEVEFIEPTTV